jgi:hypothetical protein
VAFQGDATNALQVVLDLHGLDSALAEYPIIKSASVPSDATNRMTVAFINPGANLPETAAVSLQSRADGIYAVFTGVVYPKLLYWRNGQDSGVWSTDEADAPWGVGSAGGAQTNYTVFDSVNFTDIDQADVTVSVPDPVTPILMTLDNTGTDYSFVDSGGGLLTLPDLAFTKRGTGRVAFGLPVALSNSLTVAAGTLRSTQPSERYSNATFASSLTSGHECDAAVRLRERHAALTGALSGTGTLAVTSGRLKLDTLERTLAAPSSLPTACGTGQGVHIPQQCRQAPDRGRFDLRTDRVGYDRLHRDQHQSDHPRRHAEGHPARLNARGIVDDERRGGCCSRATTGQAPTRSTCLTGDLRAGVGRGRRSVRSTPRTLRRPR